MPKKSNITPYTIIPQLESVELFLFLIGKEREEQMIANERTKIEEHIEKLSKDIEQEEEQRNKKKQLFVEDLDKQVEDKKHPRKNRVEMFRETNELSDRLTKLYMNKEDPGISVSKPVQYISVKIL